MKTILKAIIMMVVTNNKQSHITNMVIKIKPAATVITVTTKISIQPLIKMATLAMAITNLSLTVSHTITKRYF